VDDVENEDLPEEQAPGPPAFQAGDTVGQLTLSREVGKTPYREVLWECFCSCGAPVFRAQHNLKIAREKKSRSACSACRSVYTGQRRRVVREHEYRNRRFKRLWDYTGSLYTQRYDAVEVHEIREESDLPEPEDVPLQPFAVDLDQESAWPLYPDANDEEMTLEEVGAVLGVTRERARQIEAVALIKLRRVLERDEAKCDFKARLDYLKRHWPKRIKKKPATPPVQKLVQDEPKPTIEVSDEKPVTEKKHVDQPEPPKDRFGIPDNALLSSEAAQLLGWKIHTWHNRTVSMKPAGHAPGPMGKPRAFWTLEQIEAVRDKWKDRPYQPRPPQPEPAPSPRPSRKVVNVTMPPKVEGKEAFPALLVVKTKVSNVSMTIPVFVQRMARMEDGNHQVEVRFAGTAKDTILDAAIVWAKDLLTLDYSPFKTPWDD